MRTLTKTAIATALVVATAFGTSLVFARGGQCDGGPMMGERGGWQQMEPEQRQARMAQRSELQMARLELALALQAEQQPAWGAFKAALTEQREQMFASRPGMSAQRPDTAIERLARMEEMGKLRSQFAASTRASVEAFYAQLSDAQKTVFDAQFHLMDGHGAKHHGMQRMRDGGGRMSGGMDGQSGQRNL